jgi:hypothetical protein
VSAGNKFVWFGLREFYDSLRQLPDDLVGEANDIFSAQASAAIGEMTDQYGEKTGNLKRGLRVEVMNTRFGVDILVRNRAFHSGIYEKGTKVRKNRYGNRGQMPKNAVFGRNMVKHRRAAYRAVVAMMRRNGLVISGELEY